MSGNNKKLSTETSNNFLPSVCKMRHSTTRVHFYFKIAILCTCPMSILNMYKSIHYFTIVLCALKAYSMHCFPNPKGEITFSKVAWCVSHRRGTWREYWDGHWDGEGWFGGDVLKWKSPLLQMPCAGCFTAVSSLNPNFLWSSAWTALKLFVQLEKLNDTPYWLGAAMVSSFMFWPPHLYYRPSRTYLPTGTGSAARFSLTRAH